MRKYIALLLALVCVFGLVGCSNITNEDIVGMIKFYSAPTKEFSSPIYATSVELSKDQVKEIKAILDNVNEWNDDYAVNRLEYYFDGEFKLSDSEFVYYFTYENNVIYYDHYIGKIDTEEMQFIKSIEGETDKTLIDDDAVDYPTGDSVMDIATPNLTMRTLKSLVDRYGKDLTWTTFDTYYSEEVTSGLYTRSYPIDAEYSLLIIGDTDKSPTAILLVSAHNPDGIEIRNDSIDDFIKINTYEELYQLPAKELLDLFIKNGLVINDDLKKDYTEEEMQTLFKENFHLWHTGVSAHSHTMYCDLAERTKEIFNKIAE